METTDNATPSKLVKDWTVDVAGTQVDCPPGIRMRHSEGDLYRYKYKHIMRMHVHAQLYYFTPNTYG